MTSIADRIAAEIMDTIERERRINKDDLILAAERVMQKHDASSLKQNYDRLGRELRDAVRALDWLKTEPAHTHTITGVTSTCGAHASGTSTITIGNQNGTLCYGNAAMISNCFTSPK